jgi:HEAT repeat protein
VASLKTVTDQPNLAGIEKLEIAELIRLLGHDNADVAKAAALGLRYKGLSDSKIQLASELATGSANQRLELIQQLATSGEMDPRPWLVWMGEDGQPEVRKMAIALLIHMADENVYRSLRNLAARESDSHIKEMITRALLSASR